MNYLTHAQALGFVALLFLFGFCFLGVHVLRLAQATKKTPPKEAPKKEPEKKPVENEPVYYIVEKKKKSKSTYSEPKRISFK